MMEAREGSIGLPSAWSRMRGDLLDVNVWIALAQPKHAHHGFVKAYWEQTLERFAQENAADENALAVPSKLYFCRTSMLGLVRVLSQTSMAYGIHMSLAEAFSVYESFKFTPEVGFAHENLVNVDAVMGALLASHADLPMRMSTDVYLAALAKALNLRFVTFDRDFLRFDLPDCLIIATDKSA
jgi:uncharacterized protein